MLDIQSVSLTCKRLLLCKDISGTKKKKEGTKIMFVKNCDLLMTIILPIIKFATILESRTFLQSFAYFQKRNGYFSMWIGAGQIYKTELFLLISTHLTVKLSAGEKEDKIILIKTKNIFFSWLDLFPHLWSFTQTVQNTARLSTNKSKFIY